MSKLIVLPRYLCEAIEKLMVNILINNEQSAIVYRTESFL